MQLGSLLKTAETLKVKGLAEVASENEGAVARISGSTQTAHSVLSAALSGQRPGSIPANSLIPPLRGGTPTLPSVPKITVRGESPTMKRPINDDSPPQRKEPKLELPVPNSHPIPLMVSMVSEVSLMA